MQMVMKFYPIVKRKFFPENQNSLSSFHSFFSWIDRMLFSVSGFIPAVNN